MGDQRRMPTEKPNPRSGAKPERWVFLILGVTVAAIAGAYIWRAAHSSTQLAAHGSVPAFSLTNQLGQPITLDDLRGKIWIADIVFTRCAGPCPQLTKKFQELDRTFSGMAELRFVSLSADPAFDTPAVLAKYGEQYGAKPGRWWFLTGPKVDLYRLAIDGLKLGVQEKGPGERENLNDLFIHTTVFTLVDKRGRLRGFFQGLEPDSFQQLEDAVKQLAQED
jgi:cytochrome oxidase Cu insertion factor (SCO1/SenC/PrrC family)